MVGEAGKGLTDVDKFVNKNRRGAGRKGGCSRQKVAQMEEECLKMRHPNTYIYKERERD